MHPHCSVWRFHSPHNLVLEQTQTFKQPKSLLWFLMNADFPTVLVDRNQSTIITRGKCGTRHNHELKSDQFFFFSWWRHQWLFRPQTSFHIFLRFRHLFVAWVYFILTDLWEIYLHYFVTRVETTSVSFLKWQSRKKWIRQLHTGKWLKLNHLVLHLMGVRWSRKQPKRNASYLHDSNDISLLYDKLKAVSLSNRWGHLRE